MTTKPSKDVPDEFIPNEDVISGRRVDPKKRGKAIYVLGPSDQGTVEHLALEHYKKSGATGVWSENDYWWQLLAYLYWDVIYAKLHGVYFTGFGPFPSSLQDMPSDLFSPEFYNRRRRLFAKKDKEFRKNDKSLSGRSIIISKLSSAYNTHKSDPCRLIEKSRQFRLQDLKLAVLYLTQEQITLIMKRLFEDFNSNRSGFPDLFLIKDDVPFFVEVKRKKERIAPNQIQWLEYLNNTVGVEAKVCRVHDDEISAGISISSSRIFLCHEELANVRGLRSQGKLDQAEELLKKAKPSAAVLDELRKTASARAKIAKKNGDWKSVIEYLIGYEIYAREQRDYCMKMVNQEPPEHTASDKKLLAHARSIVGQ